MWMDYHDGIKNWLLDTIETKKLMNTSVWNFNSNFEKGQTFLKL